MIRKSKAWNFERVKTETGFYTQKNGYFELEWEVKISEADLEAMAERANRNKGKRCKSGPVTVKILKSTLVREVAS